MSSDTARLPLLSSSTEQVAWWQGQFINSQQFLNHLNHVAKHLPQRNFAINLCEDRYLFLVAFAAVIRQGQTNLLPSSRLNKEIQSLIETYPSSYRLSDRDIKKWLINAGSEFQQAIPEISASHIAAVPFTSGSTGRAQPHPKQWSNLVRGAQLAQSRFGFGREAGMTIVATVPPQHMYGLETSIMLPLVGGVRIHSGRPFFPEDIRATLAEVPPPRILITTPVHLRVCVKSKLSWPSLAFIISATAPLSKTLAAQVEQVFATPLLEIYGCTEAGSIASRRTLNGDLWQLYDELKIREDVVYGSTLAKPVQLNDVIEPQRDNQFTLLGRQQDLINVAGKRTSLAYLNHILNEINGVEDGVFIMPDDTGDQTVRLMALVVAPTLSPRQILAALAERIDPVFLPRPLVKLERLPRNETGKLTNESLLTLIEKLKKTAFHTHGN